jgi:hypothetical protein
MCRCLGDPCEGPDVRPAGRELAKGNAVGADGNQLILHQGGENGLFTSDAWRRDRAAEQGERVSLVQSLLEARKGL